MVSILSFYGIHCGTGALNSETLRGLSISLYKSASLSVSERVSLFVCLLQNGEPQQPEILRNDFPWDKEGFRLKKTSEFVEPLAEK